MERGYQSCSYSMVIHDGYTCDGCKQHPITGTRWFCFTCRKNGNILNYCSTCRIMCWHNHSLVAIKYNTSKCSEQNDCPDPDHDPREPLGLIPPPKK